MKTPTLTPEEVAIARFNEAHKRVQGRIRRLLDHSSLTPWEPDTSPARLDVIRQCIWAFNIQERPTIEEMITMADVIRPCWRGYADKQVKEIRQILSNLEPWRVETSEMRDVVIERCSQILGLERLEWGGDSYRNNVLDIMDSIKSDWRGYTVKVVANPLLSEVA